MVSKAGQIRGEPRLTIGTAMLMTAGLALGLWLATSWLRQRAGTSGGGPFLSSIYVLVFVLGGLSLVGVPILLWTARRRPWGAGRFIWFTQGTAAWIMWPPIAYRQVVGGPGQTVSDVCFFYGTPPIALYVTIALLAGGRLRRSRRRRLYRSWQEMFGLLLGLVWACTGLYLISLFYRQDFFGK
jgi:hypothetical protein